MGSEPFFANRNTHRDMQIQIKIHTVYTAPSIVFVAHVDLFE